MITEKFSGTVNTAYGQTLPKPITFSGEYEAYANFDEVQAANDALSADEVVAYRNNQRKANARAKATNEALTAAGIEKPTLNDESVQIATLAKVFVAKGMSQSDAEAQAKLVLGSL